MARARHKKSKPGAIRARWYASLAVVALLAGGVAVAEQLFQPSAPKPRVVRDLDGGSTLLRTDDSTRTSRNLVRGFRQPPAGGVAAVGPTATARHASGKAAPKIVGTRYTTAELNLWSGPTEKSALLQVLKRGTKVSITGKTSAAWAEVVFAGKSRWVHAAYLAVAKPADPAPTSTKTSTISAAPCPTGSAVEAGLTPDAIRVHRAVCAQFPAITRYIGIEGAYPHSAGLALDIMTTDSTLGHQIAEWVRANAARLGVSEVIYAQHIWTVQRSSEGWRLMPDRGSITANHYDHVHVTVYGNAGN